MAHADNLPLVVESYPQISPKAYEHPADRAATAALKSVPMLETVVRRLVEFRYERALRQLYLGNSVKVSDRQLPELWTSFAGVCKILDMPASYGLYVYASPWGNATRSDQRIRSWSSIRAFCSNSAPASSGACSPTSSATSCPTTCST